jgi:hypothetical protein
VAEAANLFERVGHFGKRKGSNSGTPAALETRASRPDAAR